MLPVPTTNNGIPLAVRWVVDESAPASSGTIQMLDQRELPMNLKFVQCPTVKSVHEAIFNMTIRGAPAIGAAGGYGMAMAGFDSIASNPSITPSELITAYTVAKTYLDSARPTAVNLEWATARLVQLATHFSTSLSSSSLADLIWREACDLADEDVKINRRLGEFGASIVPAPRDGKTLQLIHHCNTGALATVGHGTAIGVIYSLQEAGKDIHVWVDETRPRLQGAKLTAYELMANNVPMHLMPDSASGLLMYNNKVDVVVFGADRVALNGDVANKVGTMKLAVLAREFDVPVYACVPTSTIDLGISSGREITIEERDAREVTHVGVEQIAPTGCAVYNPAFDITPAKYLTAIITEEGVCYPPFEKSLAEAKKKAEDRLREQWDSKVKIYSEELLQ